MYVCTVQVRECATATPIVTRHISWKHNSVQDEQFIHTRSCWTCKVLGPSTSFENIDKQNPLGTRSLDMFSLEHLDRTCGQHYKNNAQSAVISGGTGSQYQLWPTDKTRKRAKCVCRDPFLPTDRLSTLFNQIWSSWGKILHWRKFWGNTLSVKSY
jgi:hypothetical protein